MEVQRSVGSVSLQGVTFSSACECQSVASHDLRDGNQSEWQSEPGGNCVLFNLRGARHAALAC